MEKFARFVSNVKSKCMLMAIGMKTKIYRFRQYDVAADAFKLSRRMATQASIRRIHAQLIRSTELEIDTRHLDADGMTGHHAYRPLAGRFAMAALAPTMPAWPR